MKLRLVTQEEEELFQKWFTEHAGDLQHMDYEEVARQAFLAGKKEHKQ